MSGHMKICPVVVQVVPCRQTDILDQANICIFLPVAQHDSIHDLFLPFLTFRHTAVV